MDNKRAIIYNALIADREEAKRAIYMPNTAPATKKLLTAKLADLNALIQEYKPAAFPAGGYFSAGGLKPYQQRVIDQMQQLAADGKSIAIDTGRRAGKSEILAEVLKALPADANVMVASRSGEQAITAAEALNMLDPNKPLTVGLVEGEQAATGSIPFRFKLEDKAPCTEPDIVAKVLDSYSKCGEASSRQVTVEVAAKGVKVNEDIAAARHLLDNYKRGCPNS